MRVLIIKTSSLGDILHTLPALSDAKAQDHTIQFDWVVEEAMASIPSWHPAVKTVIPIALRRWRQNKMQAVSQGEMVKFLRDIRKTSYDVIIDAQGLLKSAWIAWLARGKSRGYAWNSAREPWVSLFYEKCFEIAWEKHAVERIRHLFAKALDYPLPSTPPEYGIADKIFKPAHSQQEATKPSPYFVFLHGTSWATKLWPVQHWQTLGQMLGQQGYEIKLLWGDENEAQRAREIASKLTNAKIMEKQSLDHIADLLRNATGVISLDTGLGHLAAAFNVPTIALYGPTDPHRTGTYGLHQTHLTPDTQTFPCAPCLSKQCIRLERRRVLPPCLTSISPDQVMAALKSKANL